MSHTCAPALRLTCNWNVLWRTIFSLNLGKSYAIINMKEQLPLQHQRIWSFKKPVMMSDFWHLGLRKLVSIPSFLLGLIYSPSFCFPEQRTAGADVCQQWQKGWGRGGQTWQKKPHPNHEHCVPDLLKLFLPHLLRTPLLLTQSLECLFYLVPYCLLKLRLSPRCPPNFISTGCIYTTCPEVLVPCHSTNASSVVRPDRLCTFSVPQVTSHPWNSKHLLFFL